MTKIASTELRRIHGGESSSAAAAVATPNSGAAAAATSSSSSGAMPNGIGSWYSSASSWSSSYWYRY